MTWDRSHRLVGVKAHALLPLSAADRLKSATYKLSVFGRPYCQSDASPWRPERPNARLAREDVHAPGTPLLYGDGAIELDFETEPSKPAQATVTSIGEGGGGASDLAGPGMPVGAGRQSPGCGRRL